MELTIEQALQQGVAAHKEGKLEEAERLYQAILQSQPAHPDANHNLGVIAVFVNKVELALPLFKTALEANPKIEQFWLSYIDALIKGQEFEAANQVLEQGRNQGVVGEKLDSLEAQLTSKAQSESANNTSPSQQELRNLFDYYQAGRHSDAEELAAFITKQFPKHQLAWKVLGIIFGQTGRKVEAANANQTAVALSPQDAEAHNNLGLTLHELGRLNEAEASLRQAIVFKPDYAEAHNNLGNTLHELGRFDEAEASSTQAIALKSDFAQAHNNLGNTLHELGRLDEAEASYSQVIALKPDSPQAHSNLGITLQELGRLEEAEASFSQAIALKPDFTEAHNSLLTCFYELDKQSLFFDKLDYLINKDTANATIASLTCRSALKYGVEKQNLFCREPLKYVLHIDMNTQYDFKEIFVEKVQSLLDQKKLPNIKQPLLIKGYQTYGNLFDMEKDFTEQIQKTVRSEIEKYRIKFKNSKDGLITKWPTDYSLYGWLISMKSGGELKPHIHYKGWLSGSLYINVPPKSKSESGNLVVSLGEDKDSTDTRINVKKIINVVTGSLVLFPASLTHYTIPFEAEEERIVLAFDVKSK